MTIEIRSLSKKMNNHVLFDNLNFDLNPGKIYGVLGKNGTGKTTLLKLLSGLEPDENNQTMKLFPDDYSPIGIHIESPKLYPFLSGKKNIRLFTSDLPKSNYDLDFLIEEFQLQNFIDKKVKTYSLGTKQKISLIIAIMMAGKFLLLDEPTNGLDDDSIHVFKSLLLSLSSKHGLIILIATHDKDELIETFDQLFYIRNGSLEKVELSERKVTELNT